MRSYTLYTNHVPNQLMSNLQLRENDTGEVIMERTIDCPSESVMTNHVRQFFIDFQKTLPKGIKANVSVVDLDEVSVQ